MACHIYGSLLAALVEKISMGRKKALVQVNQMVAKKYHELGVEAQQRIPRLNVSDIFADDFPCLRHAKGRRVRRFAPVATQLAATLATNQGGKHTQALCKAMEEAYNLCDKKECVWKKETARKFEERCEELLAHYAWLARDSILKGEYKFSVVQKHHLLAHYSTQSRFLAPRACWAYGGESFMSLMVAVAGATVQSTPAWMLPSKILKKGLWKPEQLQEEEEH